MNHCDFYHLSQFLLCADKVKMHVKFINCAIWVLICRNVYSGIIFISGGIIKMQAFADGCFMSYFQLI